jgi:hypothetical protein
VDLIMIGVAFAANWLLPRVLDRGRLRLPALDTLFLAAPIPFKGRLVQYAGRTPQPFPGKATAEMHDYHDTATKVFAAPLANRAPGTPASDPPLPAASPHTQFAQPGKSLNRSLDSQCAIARNLGLARARTQPLLNHA